MLYLLIKPLTLSFLLHVTAHKLATRDRDDGYLYEEIDTAPEGFSDQLVPDEDFVPQLDPLEIEPEEEPDIIFPPDEA